MLCAQKKSLDKKYNASVLPFRSVAGLSEPQEITNLRAFTKLYGYVRYFHPSDEASKIPWDKFALYGAEKIKSVQNTKELKTKLEELFLPIAPTLQIYEQGTKTLPTKLPPNSETGKTTAWQHKGVGIGVKDLYGENTPYRSVRLNRPEPIETKSGSILQYITSSTSPTLKAIRGKSTYVRLTVAIKTELENPESGVLIGIQSTLLSGSVWACGTPNGEIITVPNWTQCQIECMAPENTTEILLWIVFVGRGKMWIDDAHLWKAEKKSGPWTEIPLENGDFERVDAKYQSPIVSANYQGTNLWNTMFPHWLFRHPQYHTLRIDTVNPYQGKRCLKYEDKATTALAFQKGLFDAKPFDGELLRKNLGGGLECVLPLTLPTDGKTAFGATPTSLAAFNALLKDSLKNIVLTEKPQNQVAIRLANVVMAWNVLQHFYPYFDEVPVNWDSTLTATLDSVLHCRSTKEFETLMRRMLVGLKDGHAEFYRAVPRRIVPAIVENIEGKPVIIASENKDLKCGDVILTIDEKPAEVQIREEEALISGSPQYKRATAAQNLLRSESQRVYMTVARDSDTLSVGIETKPPGEVNLHEHHAMKQISVGEGKDTVWYVDLSQVTLADVEAKAKALSEARGIVLDMRGYPKDGNAEILGYLTDLLLLSPRYLVPQIIYPDREKVQGYDTNGRWSVQPKLPRWKGKIVFLTGGGAISQAEDIMSIVEYYKLGTIVGEATAGADGNVNMLSLPGGNSFRWTGMKVLKHDGSKLHGIGVKPTIPAVRTVKGVQEGRDELLETALRLVNTSSK
mgnify:CR=1 FL=1